MCAEALNTILRKRYKRRVNGTGGDFALNVYLFFTTSTCADSLLRDFPSHRLPEMIRFKDKTGKCLVR